MTEIFIFLIVFLAAYFGTAAFRRWSLGRGVIDIPNERSSHVNPTPRGGGIVFVIICLVSYSMLAHAGSLPWSYVIGATLVAGISWIDDLRSVSFAWRLAVHFVAAGTFLFGALAEVRSVSELVASSIAVIWIVWMINAYNFMDGIDGIAGLQAVVAGASWWVLAILTGRHDVSVYGGIIVFSVLGFLIHNWQPAKIFMGDVGSAFLGFSLAAFPFLATDGPAERGKVFLAAGIVFLWFFVFDTVITFVVRLVRGEKVWQAHRSHLYQRMVISGMPHAKVTIIYGAFAAVLSAIYIFAAMNQSFATAFAWNAAIVVAVVGLSVALAVLSVKKVIS